MTLTLRRATVDDAAAFARTMGDPRVFPNLMQLPYASEALWRTRLADLDKPGKTDLLLVAERAASDGRPEVVGSAGLHPVSSLPRQRHVAMIGISVVPDAWRQGVGTALMRSLCAYAERWMHIRRIQLEVYADNAAAIALYRKFGFEREATARAYALRDGAMVDSLTMGRLHPRAATAHASSPSALAASTTPAARAGRASGAWSLRAAEPGDLEAVAALALRRGVVEGLALAPWSSVDAAREHFAKPAADCALVALAEARVVGYASLTVRTPLRRRHAASMTVFVAPEWQRHGVGSALAAGLLDWADRWAGLQRVEFEVQQGNAAALSLAQRQGFEPEGLLRGALLRDGAFVGVHVLARVRPAPLAIEEEIR